MLFPYTYVPHQMERMQIFIDFIFYEVWCTAPVGLVFHTDLFEGNSDLKEVMVEFGFSPTASARGKRFYKEVKEIYELFEPLSTQEINQFKQWYQGNNDLEKVCAKNPAARLARYTDINAHHNQIGSQLAIFFKDLYSHSLLNLAVLRKKIGNINNHYNNFVKINDSDKCPFCGINDLFGQYHSKREAYDHYLPKAIYPFNSINFKNLVPACHSCNSSYKTSKDSAYKPRDPTMADQRRAVFYPYTETPYAIELEITFQHADFANLKTTDITINFGPTALAEKLETWKDVYGIDERYKAKFLGENDGKYWFTQVFDEWQEDGRTPTDYLITLARQTGNRPYAECNFLKKPFLDACQRMGLFDNLDIEQTNNL